MLFVGGLHRSGTSLVARSLASSEHATGLFDTGYMEDEGHYLHDVVPSVREYGGPGRFAFDPRSHLTEADADDPLRVRTRLELAWRPYWADPAAGTRVEKSPQNLIQARFLQAAFPDAAFVMVIRHPAAVALATRKWTGIGPPGARRLLPKRSLRSLLEHWVVAHDLLRDDLPHLKTAAVVRFEDLVGPASPIDGIRRSLGLGEANRGPLLPASLDPRYAMQWRRWLESPIGARAGEGWLGELQPCFERWGYTLDGEF